MRVTLAFQTVAVLERGVPPLDFPNGLSKPTPHTSLYHDLHSLCPSASSSQIESTAGDTCRGLKGSFFLGSLPSSWLLADSFHRQTQLPQLQFLLEFKRVVSSCPLVWRAVMMIPHCFWPRVTIPFLMGISKYWHISAIRDFSYPDLSYSV